VEGAALSGLGMALHEGSEFVKGPKDTNLDTYRVQSAHGRCASSRD
jgi:CO/xanthine dehydrogenase Mo-binding subunit